MRAEQFSVRECSQVRLSALTAQEISGLAQRGYLTNWSNWRAAIVLGLISSSYSTVISQLAAAQVGRDAAVDWMSVAAIPGRDAMLQTEPSWISIAVGIGFHQWADFSWALVFFGLLGRWTAGFSPRALAVIAVPWAALTSALEWLLLVPVFPFAQPIFTLQQPYWIGFLVHTSSAIIYPFFPWIRGTQSKAATGNSIFLRWWAVGVLLAIAVPGGAALARSAGYELPWFGTDVASDKNYMRHMRTHHEQGVEIAGIAVQRAQDPHLRALARLMVASQAGENRVLQSWWQGWFDEPMALCSAAERAEMPGLLSPEQIGRLKIAETHSFDALFVQLMTFHHAGAVAMADKELRGSGDLRLRLMAHSIRHEQQGEIALMHGVAGFAAVAQAVQNMLWDGVNHERREK
jgi:uncharacterized protein (DUF305 family)